MEEQLQHIREESWEHLKTVLQNVTKQPFGKKRRRSQDWFEDQAKKIQCILKDKKLNANKSALKVEIRKLKNNWFQQKSEEAEKFAKENNLREFDTTINAIYGPRPRNLKAVRNKKGVLLSSQDDNSERWLTGVCLTNSSNVHLLKSLMNQSKWRSESCQKHKVQEEPDGILAEVLVHDGRTLLSSLLTIFNLFWMSARLPIDLTDTII